ncbi:hypothetical protein BC830DRAFT_1082448 [Chytriomyces sp. MP71]|nr:hypothetical protein BC830DRAFT_1082448 [Chytriomyces sp. MP71]
MKRSDLSSSSRKPKQLSPLNIPVKEVREYITISKGNQTPKARSINSAKFPTRPLPKLAATVLIPPSAEQANLTRKEVKPLPGIKAAIASNEFEDETTRVPVVLSFRDGARTTMSVKSNECIVEIIRKKLVSKFGVSRASGMNLFTHDCKVTEEAPLDAGETGIVGNTHVPVKLTSNKFCDAKVRDVFGEKGGLIFVD